MAIGPRKEVLLGARHCNEWGLCGVLVRQYRDEALFLNYFGQTLLVVVVVIVDVFRLDDGWTSSCAGMAVTLTKFSFAIL